MTTSSGPGNPGSGRCLCGAVSYQVAGPLRHVVYCHCHDCRHATGHHMAASQAAVADLTFRSDETLRWYSHQPGVRYGFCSRCGSSLFWQADDNAERMSICAGTLDQPTGLTTTLVLFRAEAGDYIVDHPDVPTEPGDR